MYFAGGTYEKTSVRAFRACRLYLRSLKLCMAFVHLQASMYKGAIPGQGEIVGAKTRIGVAVSQDGLNWYEAVWRVTLVRSQLMPLKVSSRGRASVGVFA